MRSGQGRGAPKSDAGFGAPLAAAEQPPGAQPERVMRVDSAGEVLLRVLFCQLLALLLAIQLVVLPASFGQLALPVWCEWRCVLCSASPALEWSLQTY